jgi:hypothetical protein
MADHGFLNKAFLGNHVALPVHFCDTYEDVISTLPAATAAIPRPGSDTARASTVM